MASRTRHAATVAGATALAVGLAGDLGVSAPAAQAALRAAGARATSPDRRPLAAELARSLGRDEADVRAAFGRLRATRPA
jgi:NAD/NADP transhydrogenase alpha subunit